MRALTVLFIFRYSLIGWLARHAKEIVSSPVGWKVYVGRRHRLQNLFDIRFLVSW